MTDRELMQQVYQYLTGEAVRNKTTDKHIAELISEWLAQPEQEPLTDQQKLDLVTNWFAEDWAIKKALSLLRDYGIGGKE